MTELTDKQAELCETNTTDFRTCGPSSSTAR